MHSIGIITDSHASLSAQAAQELGVRVLPMPFTIDGRSYLEGLTLSREEFFAFQRAQAEIATSQPAPGKVTALWDEALREYETILYMPISSGLSSSCATATVLAQEEPYAGRVFVVDHGRVASPLHQAIIDAKALIRQGLTAAEIKQRLEDSRDQVTIYIAVDTLRYLQKGGRITPTVAAVGTLLNVKPILKLTTGKLDSYRNCRGFNKAKTIMIESIRSDLATRFREAHAQGRVSLLAAGSANAEETAAWLERIRTEFPGMDVLYDDLSMGVSCHTGEGALAIGLSCRP